MAQETPHDQLQSSDAEAPGPDLGDFRMTPQRRQIYDVLMSRQDHPSASDVFLQVKDAMPTISLATVYNCLDAMTQSGLIRQVNLDRESSRYCANLADHAHFCCQTCGQVSDVPLEDSQHLSETITLPQGAEVTRLEVTLRGTCSQCAPDAPLEA
jgi:Fe2+ or Zn2+ uptake regulation protein